MLAGLVVFAVGDRLGIIPGERGGGFSLFHPFSLEFWLSCIWLGVGGQEEPGEPHCGRAYLFEILFTEGLFCTS